MLKDILPHGNSKEHIAYNAAVQQELVKWAASNKVDLAKGTAADARAFATHLAKSEVPAIKGFNTALITSAIDAKRSPFSRFMRSMKFGGGGLVGAAALGIVDIQVEAYVARQRMEQCTNGKGC